MRKNPIVYGVLMVLALGCSEETAGDSGLSGIEPSDGVVAPVETEDVAEPTDSVDVVEEDAAPDVLDADLPDTENLDVAGPPEPEANIVINEVVVKAVDNGPDWIELRNMGGTAVDLEGWGIRDQLNAHDYLFPADTVIPAGDYFVVWGAGSGFEYEMDFTFGIGAEARLFDTNETLVDTSDWESGDAPEGTSWGRFPDGTGEFQTLSVPTQGQKNLSPDTVIEPEPEGGEEGEEGEEEEGGEGPPPPLPLRINELLVVDSAGGPSWVEIYNPGDEDVSLTGWFATPDGLSVPLTPIGGDVVVPAEGFALLQSDAELAFSLTEEGSFWLMGQTGIKVDSVSWTPDLVPVDQSYGRIPDGDGEFQTLVNPSPGDSNSL